MQGLLTLRFLFNIDDSAVTKFSLFEYLLHIMDNNIHYVGICRKLKKDNPPKRFELSILSLICEVTQYLTQFT